MSVSRVVRARPLSSSAGMISISGDESTLSVIPALLRLGIGGGVAARAAGTLRWQWRWCWPSFVSVPVSEQSGRR